MDESTNSPIHNAQVQYGGRFFYTDSLGYFEINYVTGFCPEQHYIVSKESYKNFELRIELSAEETKYIVQEEKDEIGWIKNERDKFKVSNDTLFFFLEKTP